MNAEHRLDTVSANTETRHLTDITLPEIVGRIYETAPVSERCRMLELLLKPLGALALVGVCNGIFTKIWFRSGLQDLQIRPEDTDTVRGMDVTALTDFVQHASSDTIEKLAALLARSPNLIYSATAAMLVTLLVQRVRARRARAVDASPPPDA